MASRVASRTRIFLPIFLALLLLGNAPVARAVPVTIVAIPWGTARIDGGEPFIVPSTVMLEPGDYRLTVERQGYWPVERTIRIEGAGPQNQLVRLERR